MNAIIVALILVWTGICFTFGYDFRGQRAVEQVAAQQKVDMAAFQQLEDRYNAQSEELTKRTLESQNETQTITKYVDRIVERPVYRDTCLDDDGLRLANAALLGRANLASKPDGSVPPAHPAQ